MICEPSTSTSTDPPRIASDVMARAQAAPRAASSHRADRPERDRRIDHPHACAKIEGTEKLTVLSIARQPLGDRIAQDIAEGGDTAAEHHDLGIPRQREQQDGAAETTDHTGPETAGIRVAARCGAMQLDGRCTSFGRPKPLDRRARGDGFDATDLPARAQGTVGVDRDVADLAGDQGVAPPQPTALDITGGDAGADAEVRKVVHRALFVRQVPIGAKRCGTDIVLDMHRHTELVGQTRSEVDLVAADADIDREPNVPEQLVDGARNADTDGVHVADRHLGGTGNIEGRLQSSRDDTFLAAVCGKHDGCDHSAEPVDDGCLGRRAADVDADPELGKVGAH